jgi:hypothetical protein
MSQLKRTIILVSGKKRAGKDYLSDKLVASIHNSKKMAFADTMKDVLCDTFGITREQLDWLKDHNEDAEWRVADNLKPNGLEDAVKNYYIEYGLSFRKIIQNFGMSVRNRFADDIWARMARNNSLYDDKVTVMSDYRFPVEKSIFTDLTYCKVITVNVINRNCDTNDSHISENALHDEVFDYELDNTDKGDLTPHIERIKAIAGV